VKKAFILTAAALTVGAGWSSLFAQEGTDGAVAGKTDTLIAVAKMDLGLVFNGELVSALPDSERVHRSVDYTDAETIIDRLRILTKELGASGRYSKPELLDIKLALGEAERDLVRVPVGAQRAGREAVERYFAVLDAM
jgi:hypothetical protein